MFPQDGQSRQWYCLRYCLHLSYSSNVREVKHKVLCVLIKGKYDQSIRFRQLGAQRLVVPMRDQRLLAFPDCQRQRT